MFSKRTDVGALGLIATYGKNGYVDKRNSWEHIGYSYRFGELITELCW